MIRLVWCRREMGLWRACLNGELLGLPSGVRGSVGRLLRCVGLLAPLHYERVLLFQKLPLPLHLPGQHLPRSQATSAQKSRTMSVGPCRRPDGCLSSHMLLKACLLLRGCSSLSLRQGAHAHAVCLQMAMRVINSQANQECHRNSLHGPAHHEKQRHKALCGMPARIQRRP
jgi:hypothetical protein